MKFFAILLLAVNLLSACTTLPGRPLTVRQQVGDFALEARFALRINLPGQAGQSTGGRISWQQKNGKGRVLLSNPLGFGVAEIESVPGQALLRTANGEIRQSNDPDLLLEELTGQRLPVSRLSDWLLGRASAQAEIQYDLHGRPQQLSDADWQVDYTYDSETTDALPAMLKLSRQGEIELRLRIEEWREVP